MAKCEYCKKDFKPQGDALFFLRRFCTAMCAVRQEELETAEARLRSMMDRRDKARGADL